MDTPPPDSAALGRFHTTVTERQDFRTCRRRWYLGTVRRLTPKDAVAWALIFGECVHVALEAYYRSNRNVTDMLDAFASAWAEEDARLQATFGGLYGMGIEEEWHRHKEMGEEMLRQYHKFDSSQKFWDSIIAVNVEDRGFVDILGKNRRRSVGRPLLSGRIDLVVERKDGIWIVDHKTSSTTTSMRALEVDDQLTGYCYIWWRLTGVVPRGAVYNVLVKDPPKPPRMLKDGSLSRDKSQRTTYELFMETLNELGLPETDYLEYMAFLQNKGWRQFFNRDDGILRNLEELLSYEEHLYQTTRDQRKAIKDPAQRYHNPSQWNCGGCPFLPPCQTMEEKGDVEWILDNAYRVQEPRHAIPAEILRPDWKGV